MTLFRDLPSQQRRAVDLVREVAAEKDVHPYLVGGPVRDILLGRHSIDIDLTLEEGASTLARALAKRIEGRVRSFPQFMTYKVTADEFPEIDITTARKERYRQPGALPAVTAGRLRDDLMRRDFSINAIALDLRDGTMHDPTNGEQDIRARVVRVLHDKSFIDDPTRIFRALRLAARLGFAIESHTDALMRSAIESGAMETVSKERIWRELFLAMDEKEAADVITDLAARGALDVLFGRRIAPDRDRLASMHEELQQNGDIDRYVLYTGVLLAGDASPVDFEGSGFSQKRARAVVQIANELPRVSEALDAAGDDDRERFAIYREVSPEMLTVIAAQSPAERAHVRRFREFEKFRLPLRGNDLEVPGGPHVALALEQTREAVFRGEVPPEEARSYARTVAKRLFEEQRT